MDMGETEHGHVRSHLDGRRVGTLLIETFLSPNGPTAMVRPYSLDGILMFHFRYINIQCSIIVVSKIVAELKATLRVHEPHINRREQTKMNGETRRNFAVALASFAIGAVIASVLGNSKARDTLAEGSRRLVENFRKNKKN
jgi:hypothetical protein